MYMKEVARFLDTIFAIIIGGILEVIIDLIALLLKCTIFHDIHYALNRIGLLIAVLFNEFVKFAHDTNYFL